MQRTAFRYFLRLSLLTSTMGFATFFANTVQAAVYVTIPGVPGESTAAGYEEAIDADGAGGEFSRNTCGDFVITKSFDAASPLLIAAAVKGAAFPTIEVGYVIDAGGETFEFLTVKLEGAVLKSISMSTDGTLDRPIEVLRFAPAQVDIEYRILGVSGGVSREVTSSVTCRK